LQQECWGFKINDGFFFVCFSGRHPPISFGYVVVLAFFYIGRMYILVVSDGGSGFHYSLSCLLGATKKSSNMSFNPWRIGLDLKIA
jgi:hypothetical protein